MRLKPTTPQSRNKHSTTQLPGSSVWHDFIRDSQAEVSWSGSNLEKEIISQLSTTGIKLLIPTNLWSKLITLVLKIIKYLISKNPCAFLVYSLINSLPASDIFCRLLITFAKSLDPGQARQCVKHDLDPNCLILYWYSCYNFFIKCSFACWVILHAFFQNHLFRKKIIQEYRQCQSVWILIRPDKHVCKSYRQMPLVGRVMFWFQL